MQTIASHTVIPNIPRLKCEGQTLGRIEYRIQEKKTFESIHIDFQSLHRQGNNTTQA